MKSMGSIWMNLSHGWNIKVITSFHPFSSQDAKEQVESLQEGLAIISKLSDEVAEYFMEDKASFKLQDFLNIFKTFAERVKQANEVSNIIKYQNACLIVIRREIRRIEIWGGKAIDLCNGRLCTNSNYVWQVMGQRLVVISVLGSLVMDITILPSHLSLK